MKQSEAVDYVLNKSMPEDVHRVLVGLHEELAEEEREGALLADRARDKSTTELFGSVVRTMTAGQRRELLDLMRSLDRTVEPLDWRRVLQLAERVGKAAMVLDAVRGCSYPGADKDAARWQTEYDERVQALKDELSR